MSADRTQGRARAKPGSKGQPAHPPAYASRNTGDIDDAFDRWLDEKLREIYRATQNEPLPQDMLDLIQRLLHSSESETGV
jgi:hypothetical protein